MNSNKRNHRDRRQRSVWFAETAQENALHELVCQMEDQRIEFRFWVKQVLAQLLDGSLTFNRNTMRFEAGAESPSEVLAKLDEILLRMRSGQLVMTTDVPTAPNQVQVSRTIFEAFAEMEADD